MDDAIKLHAEIRRLRILARNTTDEGALKEIQELIQELKRRAGDLENGSDGEEAC